MVYLTLLPMLQITAPSLLTFSLLFFIVTIQKKSFIFSPPILFPSQPPPLLCAGLEIEMREGEFLID